MIVCLLMPSCREPTCSTPGSGICAPVSIARQRLVDVGFAVPHSATERPAHRLYDLLAANGRNDDAHGRYNALLRRIVSFARAAEHAAAR
jgi:hypothetical protein